MVCLALSLCVPGRPGRCVAWLDWSSRELHWPRWSPMAQRWYVRGLARAPQGLRAVYLDLETQRSGLLALDERLQLRRSWPLTRVRDAHSLLEHEGELLVVSTGNERIMAVREPVGEGLPLERIVRDLGEGRDRHHVNSICRHRGRRFVSMFGPKLEDDWYDTRSGRVLDLEDGRVVCEGLVHPHSLLTIEGRLCVLESFTGRVLDIEDGEPRELARVPGYARGAVCVGRDLFVATSFVRMRSRTGRERRRIALRSSCAVHRIALDTGTCETFALHHVGREIYDLQVVDGEG